MRRKKEAWEQGVGITRLNYGFWKSKSFLLKRHKAYQVPTARQASPNSSLGIEKGKTEESWCNTENAASGISVGIPFLLRERGNAWTTERLEIGLAAGWQSRGVGSWHLPKTKEQPALTDELPRSNAREHRQGFQSQFATQQRRTFVSKIFLNFLSASPV